MSDRNLPADGGGSGGNRLKKLGRAVPVAAVFFVLVELLLRVAGVGSSADFFVRSQDGQNFVPNEKFPRCHCCPEAPDPFLMPATKTPGSVRIFVLGESAAFGAADAAFNVGRLLETMLRDRFPGREINVYNAAVMGIDSFAVADIARNCMRHEPDLLVVYAGNNDMIGARGAGSFPARLPPALSRGLIHASVWLQSTRTGELIGRLATRCKTPKIQNEQFFLAHRIGAEDPRRATVLANFSANMSAICKLASAGGTKVVVSTLAVNLRDFPPFPSLHKPDLDAAASNRWDQAVRSATTAAAAGNWREVLVQLTMANSIDDNFAGSHFQLGRCYENLGDIEKARAEYRRAADCDAIPFRGDSRINEIIRETAATTGAGIVDSERKLATVCAAAKHVPGDDLFHDHVHFRFHGTYELACALLPEIESALDGKLGRLRATEPPAENQIAAQLAYTKWDELKLQETMARFFSRPPCTLRSENPFIAAAATAEAAKLAAAFTPVEQRRAVRTYEDAIAFAPGDWHFRADLAEVLDRLKQTAASAVQLQTIAEWFPTHEIFWRVLPRVPAGASDGDPLAAFHFANGNELLTGGAVAEAVEEFRRALRYDPKSAPVHNNLGNALLRTGATNDAIFHFTRALQLAPSKAGTELNLGLALAARHDLAGAIKHLRRAVELRIPTPIAACKLALLLSSADDASLRNGAEAVRLAESACDETQRKFPPALQALAAAYAECGRFDDAARIAGEEIRLLRDSGKSEDALSVNKFVELYDDHKPLRIPSRGM